MSNVIEFPKLLKKDGAFNSEVTEILNSLAPEARAVIESQINCILEKYSVITNEIVITLPKEMKDDEKNHILNTIKSRNEIITSLIQDLITANIKYELYKREIF